jgi:hypothetical protein
MGDDKDNPSRMRVIPTLTLPARNHRRRTPPIIISKPLTRQGEPDYDKAQSSQIFPARRKYPTSKRLARIMTISRKCSNIRAMSYGEQQPEDGSNDTEG